MFLFIIILTEYNNNVSIYYYTQIMSIIACFSVQRTELLHENIFSFSHNQVQELGNI